MKYFFILGKNPTLSIAEISAFFALDKPQSKIKPVFFDKNSLVLDFSQAINPQKVIEKLGGVIKIGVCEAVLGNILEEIKNIIKQNEIKGKFKFGISNYSQKKIKLTSLAMEIKKYLKEFKISSRWVDSREPVLSSVAAEQNHLTQANKGIEIALLGDEKLFLGKTLAVQPFKELSRRDFGRPARDDASGLIPPKLAQIMLNLAGARNNQKANILDPFCGSGTILGEALLLGRQNLIGSDISPYAIADTKENIDWLKKEFAIKGAKIKLFERSAAELSSFLQKNSIDAIVTEPYLGPQRGKFDVRKTVRELEKLYNDFLREARIILKPKGRIVMIWPVFSGKNKTFLNPRAKGFEIQNSIPAIFQQANFIQSTKRNTTIYQRPRQKILREIVVLARV